MRRRFSSGACRSRWTGRGDDRGWRVREQLESIAKRFGEDPRSRTEPDVLLDLGESGIMIIEVKHRSPTDLKATGYGGWDEWQ